MCVRRIAAYFDTAPRGSMATGMTVGEDTDTELMTAFMANHGFNVWIKDGDGRYLFVNERVKRSFAPTQPMVGFTDHQLFPREVADVLREHDLRVLTSGERLEFVEEVPGASGDSTFMFSAKFVLPVRERRYVAGVAVDITRYWRAEQDTRRTQQTLEQILDAISDMIIVKAPGSRLLWANKAFREAYGMTNAQLQGIVDAPFVQPDYTQKYVRDDRQVFETGRTLEVPEEPVTRHDGQVRTVHTVKSPIFDGAGQVVRMVAVCRDITDRKAMEMELRQSQKLEAVGRLASGIAHEINTPIQFVGDQNTFVRGSFQTFIGLFERYRTLVAKAEAQGAFSADVSAIRAAEEDADLPFLEKTLPAAFEAIADGVSRVAGLVTAMKEFGHPDRGDRSAADLNRSLRNTLVIAGNETKYAAEVVTDLRDLPLVECVVSEVNQVFLNLLMNALHAIQDVRPERRGTITVTTRQDGPDVVVSIADTGTGIPEEARGKIFEPFFTTKEVGRGTGQGLPIARMIIVEKHRGTITFDTEVGRGTTFHVRLPIAGRAD
jgi:two-component system NtrC family sensor kinase